MNSRLRQMEGGIAESCSPSSKNVPNNLKNGFSTFKVDFKFFRLRQVGVTSRQFFDFSKWWVQKSAPVPLKIQNFQKSTLSSLKNYIRRFEWATNEDIWLRKTKVMTLSKLAKLCQKLAEILYIFFYFPGEAEKIGNRLRVSVKTWAALNCGPVHLTWATFSNFWAFLCYFKQFWTTWIMNLR